MPSPAPTATRRALLIGIDRYPRFPSLAGCVNDATAMGQLLQERFSFLGDNVERLLDGAATEAAVRAAFEGLIERTAEYDVVVIHYSGHGSQRSNPAAVGGVEETIVPVDSGRGAEKNRDIGDLEIRRWLLALTARTPHVTFIFDSCHSGHILRDSFGAVGRWAPPDLRPASAPPLPAEVVRGAQHGTLARGGGTGGGFRLPLGTRYAMLAGCSAAETSFEMAAAEAGSTQHGAFTFFLTQELAHAGPQTTFRDVFEVAAPQVSGRYPSQHPQIEGARDRQVFGVTDLEPMRFVPVRRERGRVVLEAGAACGMTEGSTWAVYPPGTKSAGGGVAPLARLRVTVVRALDSLAQMEDGAVPESGGRGVEETHRFGKVRFTVTVQVRGAAAAVPAPSSSTLRTPFRMGAAASAEALRQAIRGSAILQLLDDQGVAPVTRGAVERGAGSGPTAAAEPSAVVAARAGGSACVYLLPARERAAEGDAVPALGELKEDSWAVVGGDGELLMPVHAVGEPGIVSLLVENLEKRARFRAALDLTDPQGPLYGKVHLALMGQAGGQWVERGGGMAGGGTTEEAGAAGGAGSGKAAAEAVFREGERIAFRVTHTHDAPLYLYLLDFGLSGAVSIVHPEQGGEQRPILRGEENGILLGSREGEEIELFLPDGFPFDGMRPAPASGWVETVKLFATTRETDLSSLTQRAVRGADGASGDGDSPLGQLLRMSMSGAGTRDLKKNRPEPEGDWTVVQRSFRLLPG
jgi:hypothetical protein